MIRSNKKNVSEKYSETFFVRVKGVEPPRLAALDPKSSVSTNSTTPAFKIRVQIYTNYAIYKQFITVFSP